MKNDILCAHVLGCFPRKFPYFLLSIKEDRWTKDMIIKQQGGTVWRFLSPLSLSPSLPSPRTRWSLLMMLYIFHATSCLPPFNIAVARERESWLMWSPEIVVLSLWVSLHQPFSSALYEAVGYLSTRCGLSVGVCFPASQIIPVQQSTCKCHYIRRGGSENTVILPPLLHSGRRQALHNSPWGLLYASLTFFIHICLYSSSRFRSFPPARAWRRCLAVCVLGLCVRIRAPWRHSSQLELHNVHYFSLSPCFIRFHDFCTSSFDLFHFRHPWITHRLWEILV